MTCERQGGDCLAVSHLPGHLSRTRLSYAQSPAWCTTVVHKIIDPWGLKFTKLPNSGSLLCLRHCRGHNPFCSILPRTLSELVHRRQKKIKPTLVARLHHGTQPRELFVVAWKESNIYPSLSDYVLLPSTQRAPAFCTAHPSLFADLSQPSARRKERSIQEKLEQAFSGSREIKPLSVLSPKRPNLKLINPTSCLRNICVPRGVLDRHCQPRSPDLPKRLSTARPC